VLKRPLFSISVSFVAGMYILSLFGMDSILNAVPVTVLVLLVMLIRKISIKRSAMLLLCVIIFCFGCMRYNVADDIKAKDIYSKLGKDVMIQAEIVEEPFVSESSISFIANVISVTDADGCADSKEKVRFTYYINEEDIITQFNIPKLGDTIAVPGKFKIPNGPMNTGGFDYARYLKTDGIFFICDMELDKIEITGHINRPVLHTWAAFRKMCISFFDKTFPADEGAVLKAFITGDKSGVSDDVSTTFSDSGLSHILAVSGLHVTAFVEIVTKLLKRMRVSKRKQMLISVVCAFVFVFFTGASVSALRAGVLCVFLYVGKLLYRKSDPLTTLSLAAALFALINPHVIYDASFMLSFAATAGIILFNNSFFVIFAKTYKNLTPGTKLYKFVKGFFESITVGLSAQIFVIPILVYLFKGFSVMSVIATLAVTFFLEALLLGGLVFIGLSFISSFLAFGAAGFIFFFAKVMLIIAEFFASFSFSKIIFGVITPFLLLMYALVVVVFISLVTKQKLPYVISLASLTLLSVVSLINLYITYDTARVSFINVGQGDCALISAPGDCDILVDVGGYAQSDSGGYIIAPYLISNGVTDVEYIIISHTDTDHIVGLSGLLQTVEVKNIIIPYGQHNTDAGKPLIELAKSEGINILYFTHGDVLKVNDEITITAILPDSRQYMFAKGENDTGIAIRLDYGESSFFFSGDISSEIEKYAIGKYPDLLEADVLKVAHHGSKYSNCQEFIDAVGPKYAYIPVGRNTYGHPTPEVIERLKNSGAQVYRADLHKDLTFYFDSNGIKGVKYNKRIAEEGAR